MAAALLLNRAKSIVSGGGTGVLTLGADVAGFRGIAGGGIGVGGLFAYVIEDGLNYEWGYATLTTSTTVTRTTIIWSSSSGSAITVSVGAIIGAGTFAEVIMNATNPVATGTVQLMAGTTTNSPLFFASGSLTTSASGGAVEYDGSVFYATPGTIGRGTLAPEQRLIQNADTTARTSQTAAQAAFNASANGAITVGVGTYEVECFLDVSTMSATSGSFGFAFGGGATKTAFWLSEANKAALATAAAPQMTYNENSAANTAIATATTSTVGWMRIKGILRVTVAGTIIPQISLGIASACIIKAGSYFRIKQISGSATFTTVGNFS